MRIFKNESEQAFQEYANKQGWSVSKRGWPDFIVDIGNDEFIAVEVKQKDVHHPTQHQRKVHKWLRSRGVITVVWSPDTGFRPV